MENTAKLVAEIHRENLCTYFILPLLKLNKKSFVCEDNFINSYLTREGLYIFVHVNAATYFMGRTQLHPQYLGLWTDKKGSEYFHFSIPGQWQQDVQVFIQGRYSQLSAAAKKGIHKHSGLLFRQKRITDNVAITDVRLLALDRSIAVRDLWEAHYGVSLNAEDELLSIAGNKAYIDMNDLVPVKKTPASSTGLSGFEYFTI